ncbi:histone deacetylase domain-containing protein [Microdochium trichocladiopsis]|uniref:Histone deacetylase domain-containing protein n=1 Tax=Microdochium trichocladiopsis TaxID=1682393 RepID=A0A9P8Y6V9_9PEZI|nr:histone deacetylase domain-containing protein [Microdochium trichocladiopsis]KAH7031406.1 histone deacetylase domain-containing protein [Microdochium trichocladiopsis]
MSSPGKPVPVDVPTAARSNALSHSDHDLLQSLDKLSLSTSPSNLSVSPSAPSRSPSVTSRRPSWAPLSKTTSAAGSTGSPHSRSATPTLLKKASTTSLRSANGATPQRAPSRKSSATNLRSPSVAPRSPLNTQAQLAVDYVPKPAATPASVARDYFKKELELLHATQRPHSAETIVVIHDACYGHRFSRPKASKGHLFSIVERPERLAASVLGVAMAYVRLGDRHSDGKYPIHPDLDPATLDSVPFHIHKTTRSVSLTDAVVTNVHGTKWMEELDFMCETADTKLAVTGNELKRPEMDRGPDAEPPQKFHEGDLYLCAESRAAFEGALGAVCDAVDAIFSQSGHKRAFVAVRPPGHHCSASYPSGFCWVNNVHVGIMHGILNHGLTHAAIIDFDLHHGDGSQAIAWEHNQRGLTKNAAAWKKTSIGYFSVHDINSFPCEWGDEEKVRNASVCIDNAHGQNVWNVHLHEWKTEVEFWKLYQSRYSILLEKTRQYCKSQTEKYRAMGQEPRGAIFLSAGFDASEYETDGMQRHKVNVPTEFYARLTRDVVKIASEEGLSVDGRVMSVLEGGYSDRALYSGVLSHLGGLAGTDSINPKDEIKPELNQELSSRIASLGRRRSTMTDAELNALKVPGFPYDPNWWSRTELDRFDTYVSPPAQEPKKPRTTIVPTYFSPTHASTARETDLAKTKRSMSGTSGLSGTQTIMYRVPTPPPPDVPWPAAVQELGKLLVPSDRQTTSFTWEQLNAETKARRARQAAAIALDAANKPPPPPTPSRASTRMSLRERRPVKAAEPLEVEDLGRNRRKTVGGATISSKEKTSGRNTPTPTQGTHARNHSRRLSASSTILTATHESSEQAPNNETTSATQGTGEPATVVQTSVPPALTVKKTRATPRSSPAKPQSSKTKVPSIETPPLPPIPASERPARTRASLGRDELDNITNGMKRIKINVLTKEKKEERARAEAERKAALGQQAMTESLSASTELAGSHAMDTVAGSSSSVAHDEAPVTPGFDVSAHNTLGSSNGTPQAPFTAPPAVSSIKIEDNVAIPLDYNASPTVKHELSPEPEQVVPEFRPSSPSTPAAQPAAEPDLFVPYQPEGPPGMSVPLTGPVKILEPNMGTPAHFEPKTSDRPDLASPSPVKFSKPGKLGGHHFTATSKLSFAQPRTGAPPGTSNQSSPVTDPSKTGH